MKVFNSTCNAFGSRIFGTRVDAKFDFNQWKYKQDPEEKSSFTDSNIQGPKYGNNLTVPLILDLSSLEQHHYAPLQIEEYHHMDHWRQRVPKLSLHWLSYTWEICQWKPYPPDDPPRLSRPKAGLGLVGQIIACTISGQMQMARPWKREWGCPVKQNYFLHSVSLFRFLGRKKKLDYLKSLRNHLRITSEILPQRGRCVLSYGDRKCDKFFAWLSDST